MVEAIGVKSCWLHVPARPDLLIHLCSTSNVCENDVSSKFTFVKGFDDEPEAIYAFQSPCFELKHKPEIKWIWLSD